MMQRSTQRPASDTGFAFQMAMILHNNDIDALTR
jgi:hypothetical protein